MENKTKAKIRQFLTRSFPDYDLPDDGDMVTEGFVNSLFATELVLYVEREFGIKVRNEDLDIENFRSIDALARLIDRRA